MLDAIGEWLDNVRITIGNALRALHTPIDNWLGSLPMSVALGCAIALYVIAVVWVWTLRREFVFRGAPDRRPWRDLRLWATVVVVPYVAVYLMWGR